MDFYQILQISKEATTVEIKQSYRQLALQYHPDHNHQSDGEKFRQIHLAYQTLIDPEKKTQYDLLNDHQKLQLYQVLRDYFNSQFPEDKKTYRNIIRFFYQDEQEFIADINSFDLPKILRHLGTGVRNHYENWIQKLVSDCSSENSPELINTEYYPVTCQLSDRYRNRYKRIIHQNHEYYLPLREDELWFGDDLCFQILPESVPDYQIKDHDLHHYESITLKAYLFGGQFTWIDPSNHSHQLTFPSFHTKESIHSYPDLGLPYTPLQSNDLLLEPGKTPIQRGQLIVHFQVRDLARWHDESLPQWCLESPTVSPQSNVSAPIDELDQ